jgi:hypothetical protein
MTASTCRTSRAPPALWLARATTSTPIERAALHSIEEAAKTSMPAMNTHMRPTVSRSLPAMIGRQAIGHGVGRDDQFDRAQAGVPVMMDGGDGHDGDGHLEDGHEGCL